MCFYMKVNGELHVLQMYVRLQCMVGIGAIHLLAYCQGTKEQRNTVVLSALNLLRR